jgi:hypothetical protein
MAPLTLWLSQKLSRQTRQKFIEAGEARAKRVQESKGRRAKKISVDKISADSVPAIK